MQSHYLAAGDTSTPLSNRSMQCRILFLAAGENFIQPRINCRMKKKFVLRIDEDVYEALEKWATDEFRSANGQIEWLLVHQLKLNGRYKNLKHRGLKDSEIQETDMSQ